MSFDRFDSLHTTANVKLAQDLAQLAVNEQAKTGIPVLKKTMWDLAVILGVDAQQVSAAFRLSYTAKFRAKYGFGFIAPGSGRSGEIYGYVLQNSTSTSGAKEQEKALEYLAWVHLDHLRGMQEHYGRIAAAYGLSTKRGKAARLCEQTTKVAADAIELLLP